MERSLTKRLCCNPSGVDDALNQFCDVTVVGSDLKNSDVEQVKQRLAVRTVVIAVFVCGMFEGCNENALLRPEDRIQAAPHHPRGFYDLVDRSSSEASPNEQLTRLVQESRRIKLPWSCHSFRISVLEHLVKNVCGCLEASGNLAEFREKPSESGHSVCQSSLCIPAEHGDTLSWKERGVNRAVQECKYKGKCYGAADANVKGGGAW